MRVTTDLWVSAILRRVFASGGYGAIVRRGATEAGAVFILVRSRMGLSTLYAPASQTDYADARPDDRSFTAIVRDADDATIEARLEKERRFDSDLWVLEIEADAAFVADLF